MIRTLALAVLAWIFTAPVHAQVLLPSIGPTLETPQYDVCNAPCERTAALHRDILAVSRMTPLAPDGEVVIYTRQDGTWGETALIARPACEPSPCSDPIFGTYLALHGKDLFASADATTSAQTTAVYVFRLVGVQWQAQQRLEFPVPGLVPNSLRVDSLEAAGRTVAVGIRFAAVLNGQTRSGTAVQMFERGKNGRYEPSATLSPEDGQNDSFGYALALSGDTLVVGAPYTGSTGTAYVFRRGQQGWHLKQTLSPRLPGAQSFGQAVAVSHGTIAVGAPFYFDTIDVSLGTVYLYQRSGGSWQETQTLRDPTMLEHPSESNRRFFGTTLALQAGRLMIGVGAGRPLPEEQPLTLLFQRMPAGWQPAAGFSPHVVPVRTQLSRDTALIVGAELRFGNQTYVYDLPPLSP